MTFLIMTNKVFTLNIKFKCPRCSGHQCRLSLFDISLRNPHGAVCIFCKSAMVVSYRVNGVNAQSA